MPRSDLSQNLIHFTKGNSDEEAFQDLCSIIRDRRIVGSTNKIKGQHQCVCLSETPLCFAKNGLANSSAYKRYKPFGIMFEKSHIFALGGRPVIYQTDEEYALLPDSHNWRHVKYEPLTPNPIDWTWEREWRLKCEFLDFTSNEVELIVPMSNYAERLYAENKVQHEAEQDSLINQYSLFMDKNIAIQYRESFSFPWRIVVLE